MTLETIKDRVHIGGFKVTHIHEQLTAPLQTNDFIIANHVSNAIVFRIQNGPVKENSVNGCHVDTVIEAAKYIIDGLNEKFPCRENSMAITKLDEALLWLKKRKMDREERGVEGFNKS